MEFIKDTSSLPREKVLEIAKLNFSEWKKNFKSTPDDERFMDNIDDDGIIRNFAGIIGFGTAGLRGKMLPGPINMNVEIVSLATRALAETVIEAGGSESGVVIACDSRNNSEKFSKVAATVLAAAGVKVYLFDSLRPTPELSFAIRHLKCKAGINVTASHNTSEYNGYKVYWEDGAQLPPPEAKKVTDKFYSIDISSIPKSDFDSEVASGKIKIIGEEVDKAYLSNVLAQSPDKNLIKENGDKINLLYTPLHGAGYTLAPRALKEAGFKNVAVVKSQELPDGDFPTVERPNPQFIASFNEAIKVSDGFDVIIANDPDADRMGVALKNNDGKFEALTGNQIALVLIDYIIKAKKKNGSMPENPAMVKSIVSSKLASLICERNEIEVFDVYTGFKYIGEKIKEFEVSKSHSFLFGFEESYGYLVGTYARDKDGIVASLLIAEASLSAKLQGKTLFDVLDDIYSEYGFWGEYWSEVNITNPDFLNEMASIMKRLREDTPKEIGGIKTQKVTDYSSGETRDLITGKTEALPYPPENVLTFTLEDNSSITVRPSGTEPKIKLYYFVNSESKDESIKKLGSFKEYFNF
ncbi:MAG: phospho-sugar mutase [Ruminococcaceae bacterium]|nr:phospho-sugar mutase [Oscillospiraceae bacterium]